MVNEVNLALFPVLVVTLSGDVPERTLLALARELEDQHRGPAPTCSRSRSRRARGAARDHHRSAAGRELRAAARGAAGAGDAQQPAGRGGRARYRPGPLRGQGAGRVRDRRRTCWTCRSRSRATGSSGCATSPRCGAPSRTRKASPGSTAGRRWRSRSRSAIGTNIIETDRAGARRGRGRARRLARPRRGRLHCRTSPTTSARC